MDPTTLLGIILGFALIVNGIGFAKIGNFIDIPSMVIVIGGALSATLSSYPLGILKDIPKHFAVLIRGNRYNIPKLIEQLVDLGTIARQSGLLALEDKAAEIKDPFFKQSVLMIVDANDPDKVRLASGKRNWIIWMVRQRTRRQVFMKKLHLMHRPLV